MYFNNFLIPQTFAMRSKFFRIVGILLNSKLKKIEYQPSNNMTHKHYELHEPWAMNIEQ